MKISLEELTARSKQGCCPFDYPIIVKWARANYISKVNT